MNLTATILADLDTIATDAETLLGSRNHEQSGAAALLILASGHLSRGQLYHAGEALGRAPEDRDRLPLVRGPPPRAVPARAAARVRHGRGALMAYVIKHGPHFLVEAARSRGTQLGVARVWSEEPHRALRFETREAAAAVVTAEDLHRIADVAEVES
jgi:hypothetical protein